MFRHVAMELGTNDSKPCNWKYKAYFKHDLMEMIDRFSSLESKPKIYLCFPVHAFSDSFTVSNNVIRDEIISIIKEIAKEKGLDVINLYDSLMPYKQYFTDGIHPDEKTSYLIAREILWVKKCNACDVCPCASFAPFAKGNRNGLWIFCI